MNSSLVVCESCKSGLNSKDKVPHLLPCGHTVCKKCLDSIWKRYAYIKCPFDNKKHFNDLTTFPINFLMMEMVKNHSEEAVNTSNFILINPN
jgi:hypothetical protein